MSRPRGYEAWPLRSLTPRGDKRYQQNKCRTLLAEERDAIAQRLKTEGRLDPAPALNRAPSNERRP